MGILPSTATTPGPFRARSFTLRAELRAAQGPFCGSSLLAEILSLPSPPPTAAAWHRLAGILQGESLSLQEGVARLSSADQNLIRANLPQEDLDQLNALSREGDAEMFFSQLTHLGLRFSQNGRSEFAAAIYQGVIQAVGQDFPGRPENHEGLALSAQRELDSLIGRGDGGRRFEVLARTFVEQTAHPVGIASMALAGLAFNTVRTGVLARLLTSRTTGFFTQGLAAEGLAALAGTMVEVPTFVFSGRGFNAALGVRQDWSVRSVGNDLASNALVLSLLKLTGFGARRMLSGAESSAALRGSAFQRASEILLPQAAMFTGILGAHALETQLGLRPRVDGATTLLDSWVTLFQFNIAGKITEGVMGPEYARFNQELEFRNQILTRERRGPQPPGTGVLDLLTGLVPIRSPAWHKLAVSEEAEDLFPLVVLSEANGDGGDGSPPRPLRPSIQAPNPTGEGDGSETGLEKDLGQGPRPEPRRLVDAEAARRLSSKPPVKIPRLFPSMKVGPAEGPDGERRFTVLQELGSGGFGTAYKVLDSKTGRAGVIKVPTQGNQPEDLENFEKEIWISENLGSGWAVTIYDHFELLPGSGIIVPLMEFVEGRELFDLLLDLRNGNAKTLEDFPVERRLDLFADLCLGVHDAHEHKVTHNDLKPSNIMVDRHKRMRILDWGLARYVGEKIPEGESRISWHALLRKPQHQTNRDGVPGAVGYVAPEMGLSTPVHNERSVDIFDLGVILYEMATLSHPFAKTRPGNRAKGEPELVPMKNDLGIVINAPANAFYGSRAEFNPPEFSQLLREESPSYLLAIGEIAKKAMAVKPEDRYQNVLELREAVLMARAHADRETLNQMRQEMMGYQEELNSSWSKFNVASQIDPDNWTKMQQNMRWLRELNKSWHQGAEDLVTHLNEVMKYDRSETVRRMIAEVSWERLVDGGDRMPESIRRKLIRRIRDNDVSISLGSKIRYSELLNGGARLNFQIRTPNGILNQPEALNLSVYPLLRERDEKGRELGTFRKGPAAISGNIREIHQQWHLPVGFYVIEGSHSRYAFAPIPVQVRWEDVLGDVKGDRPFRVNMDLIYQRDLPPGMTLIQGGRAALGFDYIEDGNPSYVYSFPLREVEIKPFLISTDPVTVGDYIPFIRSLLAEGKVEEARAFLPRKDQSPQRISRDLFKETAKVYWQDGLRAAWEYYLNQLRGNYYYWQIKTRGFWWWKRSELVDPTTHLDPNGDPIHLEQPIAAETYHGAEAYLRWRSEEDGVRYRIPTAEEKEKVDRNSFLWPFPWGYDFAPSYLISRLAFRGDFQKTAYSQPVGQHPLGPDQYRDKTLYGTRDNLGNVREYTSSQGEPDTVVLSGGSVRVPYGPFYLPASRNYAHRRSKVDDAVGAFRRVIDLPDLKLVSDFN